MFIGSSIATPLATLLVVWSPPAPEPGVYNDSLETLDAEWAAGAPAGFATPAREREPLNVDLGQWGQWTTPLRWDVIAIHAAMLPTGKVLHYSYPDGTAGSRARLWDPATGGFSIVTMSTDIFCSGLGMLPDGNVFIAGGNSYACQFQGRQVTHIFNATTQDFTMSGLMVDGRWYPTVLPLGDGRMVIFSGRDTLCHTNPMVEIYTPGLGLSVVKGADRFVSLFPRMHLLTSGKIAHVGSEGQAYTFDPQTTFWQFIDNSNFGYRCQGTSVLVPGFTDRILIVGGNCPLTNSAEIIDFSDPVPQFRLTGSMTFPRAHADAVILPDGKVMVVGGGQDGVYGLPINTPELFDPQTETWQRLALHAYGRMYHATTVLLPDGRVIVAGQDNGVSMYTGEIYSPGYLFRGPQPEITLAPPRVSYGQPFSVATPQAADIASAALIALTTVTHSNNTSQRYVGLDFEVLDTGALSLTGPPGGTHAPPGYYMMFLVDGNGVPSVARFVQVGAFIPGDLNGNGSVGNLDLLVLLAFWGGCAGCQADLDGNGVVNANDLLILLANWG